MQSAHAVISELTTHADKEKALFVVRYFKAGKGEYGEGDVFWGITVPAQRVVAKQFRILPLMEVKKLLMSEVHEHRQTALMILGLQFQKADELEQGKIFDFCMKHTPFINNWDLVDTVSPGVVGPYFLNHDRSPLYTLARSSNIWERRIAIVATHTFIRAGQFDDTIKIAAILLNDTHDLIHKAVGWMLREMGKRDEAILRKFLDTHAKHMPRTMLRYAIEKFGDSTRKKYLAARDKEL